jgi:hypothetical protein
MSILEGFGKENVGIFYGHLEHIKAVLVYCTSQNLATLDQSGNRWGFTTLAPTRKLLCIFSSLRSSSSIRNLYSDPLIDATDKDWEIY